MARNRILLCALAVIALCPAPAPAQFFSMYGPQSSMVSAGLANTHYLMNQGSLMLLQAQIYQNQRRMGQGGGGQSPPQGSAPVRRPPGDFTFPYQGRLLSMDELAATISNEPGTRRQVARELGELVQTVADDMKRDGSPYDLSKAFTLFTSTMYSVLNPGAPLTGQTLDRLRMQFRSGLLEESAMRGSPQTLQKQWEALVAISGWTLMANELATVKQNHALAGSLREAARAGLQTVFRTDPNRLRLDPDGEWPLTVSAEASPAPAGATGQPAPAASAAPPQSAAAAAPAAKETGGAIRVGHHHFLTGMHPATLQLADSELIFDPGGHACNQPRLSAPYAAIQVRDPAVNGNGELLLNVRMPDPRNPRKMINLNFVSGDSWIDESSGASVVRSPAGAAERLRELAAELRRQGAK